MKSALEEEESGVGAEELTEELFRREETQLISDEDFIEILKTFTARKREVKYLKFLPDDLRE